jgi:hypothetical protein
MIYSKLQGTTASEFRLGKRGITITSIPAPNINEVGKFKVTIPTITGEEAYTFLIGVDEVNPDSKDIPSSEAIIAYIQTQIGGSLEGNYLDLNTSSLQTVTSEVIFSTDITVQGDLNVQGVVNSVSTENLTVEDKTITLADGALNSSFADGAGIIVDGADASILYNNDSTTFDINIGLKVEDDIDIGGDLTVTGVITSGGERVVTSVSGSGLSVGDAVTAATIEDGELVLTTDNFVRTGGTNQTISGVKTFEDELNADAGIVTTTLESTIETGTAPLTVASTTKVDNLNADKLDNADLETTITDSDTKIPTSKAVLTFGVKKDTKSIPIALTFADAKQTSEKANKYMYVYDESTDTSEKVSLNDIHRPSAFTVNSVSDITEQVVKIGDFVYIKQE